MARTIDYWYSQIVAEKEANPELTVLNSTSKVSIWRLMGYVVAVVMWSLDNLFDLHRSEIDTEMLKQKPHSERWYREKALAFQYGQDLLVDSDKYANIALNEAQVDAQKIVKVSSVTAIDGRLRVKVAKEMAGELIALTLQELESFEGYMAKIKDAGVKLNCDSLPADRLRLSLDIWYNPLVLNASGQRIDGANNEPVKQAIRAYLKELPFNGEFANTRLVDKLQGIDGVVLPVVKISQAKYGLFPFSSIDEKYIPDAGYLKILDEDLTINYR